MSGFPSAMEPSYSWQSIQRQPPSFKIETTRNLGWWILLALLISVIALPRLWSNWRRV